MYSNKNYLPSGAAVSSYVWECKEPNFVRIISGSTSSSCQIEVVGYFSGPIAVTCTIYYTQLRDGYMYSGYCMGASHTIRINQSSSEDPEDPGTGYTITLDPQGGTVYPSYVKRNSGETYGDLPTPTRDGYIFDYWYYEVSSYENAIIGPSTRIQKNANHTLYAEWTPATYTISFNGNGSTGGSMSSMTCRTNTSYSLSANRFTYTGRVFQCWNTQSNGLGVSYSDGQNIKDLASAGSSITLYAIWKSADKQIPQCSVTLGTSSYTYDGSEKKPAVTVRDGTQKLVQGTDFTLTYQNNINAGTASVTITGIGSYSSSKTINYTIKKASQTVSASINQDSIVPGTQCAIQASGIGALSFVSDNTDIATVDANGTITGIGEGTVNITVTAAGNTNYNSASIVISIAITAFGPEVCGPNIDWSISNGVLTLSGSGSMFDWPTPYADNAPWYDRRDEITSVVLSDEITSIGKKAFYDCRSLTSVTIPNSVTSIGAQAFYFCNALTNVTIPSSVTSIGRWAFAYCYELTSVTIPNSVTSIGEYAFRDCRKFTSFMIPSSITSIEKGTFDYCERLKSVTIPNSVTSIGHFAFTNCSELLSITIPSSVTFIGDGAFSSCKGLTSITVPKSVNSIGNMAFSKCSRLTSMTLPFVGKSRASSTGIEHLFSYIFGQDQYDGLTSVNQYMESGGYRPAYIPSGLKTVVITDATQLGYGAFYGCSMLTSVTLPNTLTSIGTYAFKGCKLTVRAPSGINNSLVKQYGGTLTWTYYNVMSLENAVIDPIPGQFYTGSAVMPLLTVTCNGVSLAEGADYTASFTDNQNVGTAGVIISGFGKYTGTASASFNIIPYPLEAAVITGISEIQNADLPMALNPTVTLNGLQLTLNTDYTTSYKTDINGNAAIIITGCGNYSGTAEKSYRLVCTSALILPKSVTRIYSEGFANSNCRYVVIPDGCQSIGAKAFANCENLCRIWIPASVKTISADAFSGCSAGLVITAPLNSTAHQFAVSNGYLYEQAIE